MLPTTPPNLTAQGTILGTLQYMAPEQLEGQEADARTDIFAFGAVLYEMITGARAFEGRSQASLIAAIMKDTPPPCPRRQPLSPASLDRLVALMSCQGSRRTVAGCARCDAAVKPGIAEGVADCQSGRIASEVRRGGSSRDTWRGGAAVLGLVRRNSGVREPLLRIARA